MALRLHSRARWLRPAAAQASWNSVVYLSHSSSIPLSSCEKENSVPFVMQYDMGSRHRRFPSWCVRLSNVCCASLWKEKVRQRASTHNKSKNQLDALAKADVMSSELTYVIVKPCGFTMVVGAQKDFTVG